MSRVTRETKELTVRVHEFLDARPICGKKNNDNVRLRLSPFFRKGDQRVFQAFGPQINTDVRPWIAGVLSAVLVSTSSAHAVLVLFEPFLQ